MLLFLQLLVLVSGSLGPAMTTLRFLNLACPSAEVPGWVAAASTRLKDFCDFKQSVLPELVATAHPLTFSGLDEGFLWMHFNAFQAEPVAQRSHALSIAQRYLAQMDVLYASSLLIKVQRRVEEVEMLHALAVVERELMVIQHRFLPLVEAQLVSLSSSLRDLQTDMEEAQELAKNLQLILDSLDRYSNGQARINQIAFLTPGSIPGFQIRALRIATGYIEQRNFADLIRYIRSIASKYRPRILEIVFGMVRARLTKMLLEAQEEDWADAETHETVQNAYELQSRRKEHLQELHASLASRKHALSSMFA